MYTTFLPMIQSFSSLYHVSIDIYDADGHLLETTRQAPDFAPSYSISDIQSPFRIINCAGNADDPYLFSIPVSFCDQLRYRIVISSKNKHTLEENGASIRIALQGLLSCLPPDVWEQEQSDLQNPRHQQLIQMLLEDSPNQKYINQLVQTEGFDAALYHCVILIDLKFQIHEYFNINLNLGYDPIVPNARAKIMQIIQNNKYFNAQDFFSFYKEDALVIVKSFIPTPQVSRIYRAMDVICMSLEQELSSIEILNAKIAYGSLCKDLTTINQSYQEAKALIQIGKGEHDSLHFYNIEKVVLGSICHSLPHQIVDKIVLPSIDRLRSECSGNYTELLESSRVFVECCMNLSEASKILGIHRNTLNNRLTRFYEVTHLDAVHNFQDAVLIMIIDKYARQNHLL